MLIDHQRVLMETYSLDAAILDLHFSPDPQHRDCFATATSKGTVDLYSLNVCDVKKLRSFMICDPSILVLSLSWKYWDFSNPVIALSLSDGRIAKQSINAFDQTVGFANAHSLEAWTTAWFRDDGEDCGDIYSGGDDSTLCRRWEWCRYWFETACELGQSPPPANVQPLRDVKTHGAGVTAILPLSLSYQLEGGQIVVTGSYDQHVRVLLIEDAKQQSKQLAELDLHGGVWRLEALKKPSFLTKDVGNFNFKVLASCMHAGTRILRVQRSAEGKWSIEILAQFLEHESMNYASDARSSDARSSDAKSSDATSSDATPRLADIEETTTDTEEMMVVSSSFYDKKLCLWRIPNDKD